MAELQNRFSWSFSRHKLFEECRRAYYWQYYGSWMGWREDGPDQARLAYRLKQMATLPMWLGDLVHRMAERIVGDLKNHELNTVENYQKQLRGWMNKEWMQSVEGKWRWKPKYNLNLFEHYYGEEPGPERRAEARDKVYRCVRNLMEGPVFEELAALGPEAWKSQEKLEEFEVGGAPVFVKIDLATQHEDRVTLWDWKTGKETGETREQLAFYALFATQVWRLPLERLRLVGVYLDGGERREYALEAEDVIRTRDFVMRSMEGMRSSLSGDPAANEARIEDFPMVERPGLCLRCRYRELCYGTRENPFDQGVGAPRDCLLDD